MRPKTPVCILLAGAITVLLGCAQKPAHQAFFDKLQQFCGQSFTGTTQFPEDPEHPLAGKILTMRVASCSPTEIRIPFDVDSDRSRTWILTLGDDSLLLKHDHRHEDGTPDEITNYGGWASAEGTANRQSFPADEETAELLPEAATNVWTLIMDEANNQFTYDLQRHGQPRYRAVFELTPTAN